VFSQKVRSWKTSFKTRFFRKSVLSVLCIFDSWW